MIISQGQIAELLIKNSKILEDEQKEAKKAALNKQNFQQIDDTGARLQGRNGYTIATCNDYFTSYDTGLSKNRLSALNALGIDEPRFVVDDFAIFYLREKLANQNISKQLERLKSTTVFTEEDFLQKIIARPEISSYGSYAKKHITEACAIGAYRSGSLGVSVPTLVCDDAPQFKNLTEYLQLCWVHENRHFKKLEPHAQEHRTILESFRERFWEYYDKLKLYKVNPTEEMKEVLREEFDELFTPNTDYFALNRTIKKTRSKKESLLTVLDHPEIPLHNNACELDVREKVIQRKIRNCHRSNSGARASDIFLGLMATCRKNGISFWSYIKDRVYRKYEIPRLAEMILKS